MAGRVRHPIDVRALEVWLSKTVPEIEAPLDVKQVCFKFFCQDAFPSCPTVPHRTEPCPALPYLHRPLTFDNLLILTTTFTL